MRGDIIINDHPESHYKTLFSRDTGFFARIEDDGYPEPFWSEEGPELLDVAIGEWRKEELEKIKANPSQYVKSNTNN